MNREDFASKVDTPDVPLRQMIQTKGCKPRKRESDGTDRPKKASDYRGIHPSEAA
jgi:hypothetical protein